MTTTVRKTFFLVVALMGLHSQIALASTSEMSYEGVLTDVTGHAVTTATAMSVRITDGASCVVHTQSFSNVTPDSSGFFTLRLTGLDSDDFNLPGNCPSSTARFFELTIGGEAFPLIELDTVPYANVARYTQTLSGSHGANADNQVLTWNNSTKTWYAATPGAISLPDVGTPGTFGNSSSIPVFTTDLKGRVTNVANTPISITPAAISGTIPVAQGGTGTTTLPTCTAAQFLQYDGATWSCSTPATGTVYTAGDGLTLTGNDFSVNVDNTTLEMNADTLRIKDSGIHDAKIVDVAWPKVTGTPTDIAGYGITDAVKIGGNNTGSALSIGTIDSNPLTLLTNNTEKVRVLADGRVGIGTQTPFKQLTVTAGTSKGILVTNSDYSSSNGSSILIDTYPPSGNGGSIIKACQAGQTCTQAPLFLNPSGSNGVTVGATVNYNKLDVVGNASIGYTGTTAPTNGLIVYGNTGLGVPSPSAKLDIDGAIKLSNASMESCVSPSDSGKIRFNGADLQFCPSGSGWTSMAIAGSIASNSISYSHLNSTGASVNDGLLVKDSSGRLFSKQCSSNQVLNWTIASGWDCITPVMNNGNTGTLSLGTTDASPFLFTTNGIARMTVHQTGKVGIGILAPTTSLHVSGNDAAFGVTNWPAALAVDASGSPRIALGSTAGGGMGAAIEESFGSLNFITASRGTGSWGGQVRMTVDPTGKVGIGAPAPTHTLHVNGDAKVEADIYFGRHIASTGSSTTVICTGGSSTVNGNDVRGTVGISTGITDCTITFANSYSPAPHCVVSWVGSPSGTLRAVASASSLVVYMPSTASASSFSYICIQ